jgi:hypothetical protein
LRVCAAGPLSQRADVRHRVCAAVGPILQRGKYDAIALNPHRENGEDLRLSFVQLSDGVAESAWHQSNKNLRHQRQEDARVTDDRKRDEPDVRQEELLAAREDDRPFPLTLGLNEKFSKEPFVLKRDAAKENPCRRSDERRSARGDPRRR